MASQDFQKAAQILRKNVRRNIPLILGGVEPCWLYRE